MGHRPQWCERLKSSSAIARNEAEADSEGLGAGKVAPASCPAASLWERGIYGAFPNLSA